MLRLIAKNILLLAAVSSTAVAQDSMTAGGRWRVHGWLNGNDLEAECTFAQRGHALTGRCTSEQGTTDITGQSSNGAVSWSYESDVGGSSTTLRYVGVLSGRRISGKITTSEDPNAGAFKADLIQ